MQKHGETINPAQHRDELFELYSIPAFDSREPQILKGSEIGSTKQIVEEGDVMISKIVPHIRRAWPVGPSRGRRMIASSEWIVLRDKRIEPAYMKHQLVEDRFHAKFMQTVSGVGGSLLRARPTHVAKIEILLPSLSEQRRIAAVLDKADELRTKRRATLAELDTLTQSIFLEMFGDPATNPRGWITKTLGDAADIVTGFAFRSDEYVTDGDSVRLCRGANVLPGRIDWSDLARWPTSKTSGMTEFVLEPGDVVTAMDRPWISEGFKIARVSEQDCPALLVQRVARIRSKDKIPNEFLYYLLKQPAFTRHCRPTETTVPHISPKEIRSFCFPTPPIELQRDFARRITAIEALKAKHGTALAELDALFASLQHRAFRGEL